jgi:hypothetical protein
MKISDFVTSISSGIARTNRFSIIMDLPWAALPTKELNSFSELRILCDQVQLPGLNVNTAPIRTFGEIRETPYELAYEPIQFTFYSDAGMNINAYFSEWIKNIQNPTRRSFRYYDDYICKQMQIMVQDTEDDNRYQVNLYEVYPKSIGSVQLDYGSKDVMKFTVTMIYKYWEYAVIDKPPSQGISGMTDARALLTRGLIPGVDYSDPDYDPDIDETTEIEDGYGDDWGDAAYDNSIPDTTGRSTGGGGGSNTRGLTNNQGNLNDSPSIPSQGIDSNPTGGDDYQNDAITQADEATADEYTEENPTEEEFSGYEADEGLDF